MFSLLVAVCIFFVVVKMWAKYIKPSDWNKTVLIILIVSSSVIFIKISILLTLALACGVFLLIHWERIINLSGWKRVVIQPICVVDLLYIATHLFDLLKGLLLMLGMSIVGWIPLNGVLFLASLCSARVRTRVLKFSTLAKIYFWPTALIAELMRRR